MLDMVRGKAEANHEIMDLEHTTCYQENNNWNALTDGRWKYIYSGFDGSQQLFDLKNDPHELEDLASHPTYLKTLKEWRQKLVEHFAERDERYVIKGDLVVRKKKILYSPNYPGETPNEKA